MHVRPERPANFARCAFLDRDRAAGLYPNGASRPTSPWRSCVRSPAATGLSLYIHTVEPGSSSEDRLRLLASWAATQDQAERPAASLAPDGAWRSGRPIANDVLANIPRDDLGQAALYVPIMSTK
jgi:hypothetical protein